MKASFFSLVGFQLVVLVLVVGYGESQNRVAPVSVPAPNRTQAEQGPAEIFVSVLAGLKEKTEVPVLLPSELPGQTDRLWASPSAETDSYSISIFYDDGTQLGVGANFYGMFSGVKGRALDGVPGLKEVSLEGGNTGFFRPISCGGSCAPANLWWIGNRMLYHIQLKLRSSLSEPDQEEAITAVANSAILAGPR